MGFISVSYDQYKTFETYVLTCKLWVD